MNEDSMWLNARQLNEIAQLYPWHHAIWRTLTQNYPRLGHGLLLSGKVGCGKQAFAAYLIKWLLCAHKNTQGPCDVCTHCIWIAAGHHPQFKMIAPDYDSKKDRLSAIKIEQIRDLADFVQQTSEGHRIILINYAEQLNLAASNALLKTLEEPSQGVILILITGSALQLSSTIRSRLQLFQLDRIVQQQAIDFLSQSDKIYDKGQLSSQQMVQAVNLAYNMPLQAVRLLNSEWFYQRKQFAEDWITLVSTKQTPMVFAQKWYKQFNADTLTCILQSHVQDCIAIKLGQSVRQQDLDLAQLADRYALATLFEIWQYSLSWHALQLQNVQFQLIVDELAMRLLNLRPAN